MQKKVRKPKFMPLEKKRKNKVVVCKFGGTSLADAKNIKIVADIIKGGKKHFVVVSAPGKRDKKDTKITDILINCFTLSKQGKDFTPLFLELENRFVEIAKDLDVKINLSPIFQNLKCEIESQKNYHFVISRGEFILAKIVAKYLNYIFLDAKDFLVLNDEREVDLPLSKKKFIALVKSNENYVIPGFYGENLKGEIVTFSRGGSDVTGAIVASLTEADVYENFTDVDGFFSANPQIVNTPKLRKILTYDELRALSFFGANVLHPSCVQFLKEKSIVLNLKNTFNSSCSGSFILPKNDKKTREIAGISGEKNFLIFVIKKFDIQNNFSAINLVAKVLKNNNLTAFEILISLDQVCVILKNEFIENFSFEKIVNELKNEIDCDSIEVREKVAIISVVGEAISNFKSIKCKIFRTIFNLKKEMIFLSQDARNIFIQFATDEKNFEKTINFLHKKLL